MVQGALSSTLGTVDDAYKALGMREMGLAVKTVPTFKIISGNEARTALECTAPARPSAVVQAVEVTLNNEPAVNGEPAAHSLTSDGVEYHFYDPAAVQVTGVFPLAGPSRGGTLVTLSGSGFYDRGGVFCRFGALRAGGYRHLDCAWFYQNEDEVGSGMREFLSVNPSVKREDIFITTKVWNHLHEPEDVEWSIRDSLEKLQTPYVDAFLVHWPIAAEKNEDRTVKIGEDGKVCLPQRRP